MGRCHEFGLQIHDGCGHPMVAGENACACSECGVVCGGRFAGCPDVWARGPQPVSTVSQTVVEAPPPVPAPANGNGRRRFGSSRTPAVVTATAEPGAQPQPGSAEASAAALRWLEAAFAGLREELQAVRTSLEHQHAYMAEVADGMAQQQAMLDELLALREGDARLKTVAQSLPGLVGMAVTRAVEASEARTVAEVEGALGRVIEAAVGRAADAGETRAVATLDDAVSRAVAGGETRTMAALETAFARAVEQSEARASASLDDALTRAVEASEARIVAAVAESVSRAVETTERQGPADGVDPEAVSVGVRSLMESDPATGSVIAAIATQAANQSLRSEIAGQLPETVEKALAGSDARLEHLVGRMEKVVARAVRVAARAAETAAPEPSKAPATRTTKKAVARKAVARKAVARKAVAKKAAKTAKKARQPQKTRRTSAQATRPSRRSLGT